MFKGHTMIPKDIFIKNLLLVDLFRFVQGPVVECGTWKGGMIAGIAKTLGPSRTYYLFDSYQGMPAPGGIDATTAMEWQTNTTGPEYHDNCTASEDDARDAMKMSGASDWLITAGWFEDTLQSVSVSSEIAILRLDADWYEATMTCLEALFPHMAQNGIVIIDDYYVFEGCSRAVHDYLSAQKADSRMSQFKDSVAYILKR
jgi:O-methyltransferase